MLELLHLATVAATLCAPSKPSGRPNVVMLAADDLRPLFGESYGVPEVLTPQLDRFFLRGGKAGPGAGLVFRRSYVQIAVCGPSRSSILTGRRPDSTWINEIHHPSSWCWCQRGEFRSLPHYFREQGYVTGGAGKIFHPDACGGDTVNLAAHSWCNYTHEQGDDGNAWELQYFPRTDLVDGLTADCVQYGVVPCPKSQVPNNRSMGNSSQVAPVSDLDHPDGRIASWGIATLQHFAAEGARMVARTGNRRPELVGVEGGRPFFLAIGVHKPHLPHIVPAKYFDLYPDVDKISLPPNPHVPSGFPAEAWFNSHEIREYTDTGPPGVLDASHPLNFAAQNFSEDTPVGEATVRHIRRGYFAATSFTDAQLGRVISELEAGPFFERTITVLWSDHGWHLGDTNSWSKFTNFETATRNTLCWHVPWARLSASGYSDQFVQMTDLYPTLSEVAGLSTVPACKGDPDPSVNCTHGRSYASAFGVGNSPPRQYAIHQWPYNQYATTAIPHTANPTIGKGTMAYGIRTAQFRYIVNMKFDIRSGTPDWNSTISRQLYDMQHDTHETTNLAVQAGSNVTVLQTMAALHLKLREALDEG